MLLPTNNAHTHWEPNEVYALLYSQYIWSIYVHMHVHIHIHMCMHTHTHTHTYTHTLYVYTYICMYIHMSRYFLLNTSENNVHLTCIHQLASDSIYLCALHTCKKGLHRYEDIFFDKVSAISGEPACFDTNLWYEIRGSDEGLWSNTLTSSNSIKTSCSTLRQTVFVGIVRSGDNNKLSRLLLSSRTTSRNELLCLMSFRSSF